MVDDEQGPDGADGVSADDSPDTPGPEAPAETAIRDAAQLAQGAERGRMRAATLVFSLATIVSRFAGLAREVISATIFGVGAAVGAFTVAVQLPNLVRSLVADAALSAAFVPVFTELKEKGETERAWRVASTMLMLIVLVLVPLSLLCMALAPQIVGLFDLEAGSNAIAVDLFRIMMPIVLLMALNGIIVGVLHSYDHFASPALAPIAWNAIVIGSLAIATFVEESDRIYLYAVGWTLGIAVQVLIPVFWLRGRGARITFSLDWRDPAVRSILLIMLPVTLSLGLINVNLLVNTFFSTILPAAQLPDVDLDAGPAILAKAFMVYMLPQGVFSVAVSAVVFPALARYAARGDKDGFRSTFANGLRQIFVLLLPCTLFMAVLAEPIIRLLFEYGDFDAAATELVAASLLGLAVGLVFNGCGLLLIRSFFSLKKPWIPTLVAALNLAVNAVANVLLYETYGVFGISLATSIVNVVSFVVMYLWLRREVGRLETGRNLRAFVLVLLASGIAAAISFGAWHVSDELLGPSRVSQVGAMSVALVTGAAAYLGIILRLRLVSGSALQAMLHRKRRKDAR